MVRFARFCEVLHGFHRVELSATAFFSIRSPDPANSRGIEPILPRTRKLSHSNQFGGSMTDKGVQSPTAMGCARRDPCGGCFALSRRAAKGFCCARFADRAFGDAGVVTSEVAETGGFPDTPSGARGCLPTNLACGVSIVRMGSGCARGARTATGRWFSKVTTKQLR